MAGGRPQRDEAERRDAVLSVRVTAAERARIEARAAGLDAHLADFLRSAVLDRPAPPRRRSAAAARGRLTADELRELNRIGVNLNQIARALNVGTRDPISADLADTLTELRAVLGRFV
jgi:hypothetical protein